MKEQSRFRDPVSNVRWTSNLFWDRQAMMPVDKRVTEPLFTLHQDKPGLINARKAYVELADPTGYKFANLYLENYSHWQLLMKQSWFRQAKEQWDIELDAKLTSEGLDAVRLFADGIEGLSPAVQLNAAKYLANRDYRKAEPKRKAGRPSTEEVEGELKREAANASSVADDLARIRSVS